jgi:hypothetical protein
MRQASKPSVEKSLEDGDERMRNVATGIFLGAPSYLSPGAWGNSGRSSFPSPKAGVAQNLSVIMAAFVFIWELAS